MRGLAVIRAILYIALPVVLGTLTTGCGAMFNQGHAVVPVQVNPPGARVYVDGQYFGPAPLNVPLSTTTPHTIDIQADGYERQTTQIDSHVNGGYVVLDCVLLVFLVVPGIIALVVDGSTGDWRVPDRNYMSFSLNRARIQPAAPPPAPAPAAAPAPSGCQYDAQCKGDRICVGGTCLPPPPGAPPKAGSDRVSPPAE
jgi:hypothetical protein